MNDVIVAGFPISPSTVLKQRGEHLGVHYEITNHARDGHCGSGGTWCYYVIINEEMVGEAFAEFWLPPQLVEGFGGNKTRISYDYLSASFVQVDWHCGVTYYEKYGGIDGERRYVKIGCDFAHYWDEGHQYDFSYVQHEAEETIYQLKQKHSFLFRCPYFGTYQPESEMLPHPKTGHLYSVAGIAKIEENLKSPGLS